MSKKKTYFVSDFHLGIPNIEESHKRERHIINWINEYDGMIYYINDEKEDPDIDICNDKSFYATLKSIPTKA